MRRGTVKFYNRGDLYAEWWRANRAATAAWEGRWTAAYQDAADRAARLGREFLRAERASKVGA